MQPVNPFSLRLQLIQLAKDLVLEEYHVQRERILEEWRLAVELARDNVAAASVPKMPELPPYPTENDILRKANILNEFVSKNK